MTRVLSRAEAIAARPASAASYWFVLIVWPLVSAGLVVVAFQRHEPLAVRIIAGCILLVGLAGGAQAAVRLFAPERAANLSARWTPSQRKTLRWWGFACQNVGLGLVFTTLFLPRPWRDLSILGWTLNLLFLFFADLRGEKPYVLPRRKSRPTWSDIKPVQSEEWGKP